MLSYQNVRKKPVLRWTEFRMSIFDSEAQLLILVSPCPGWLTARRATSGTDIALHSLSGRCSCSAMAREQCGKVGVA